MDSQKFYIVFDQSTGFFTLSPSWGFIKKLADEQALAIKTFSPGERGYDDARQMWTEYLAAQGSKATVSGPPAERTAAFVEGSSPVINEAQARRQWAADPRLQAEFGGAIESYLVFLRVEKAGLVSIAVNRPPTEQPADFVEGSSPGDDEGRARREWESSSQLQSEFGGNFELFLTYKRNEKSITFVGAARD